jgi:hypothetical protein
VDPWTNAQGIRVWVQGSTHTIALSNIRQHHNELRLVMDIFVVRKIPDAFSQRGSDLHHPLVTLSLTKTLPCMYYMSLPNAKDPTGSCTSLSFSS